MLQGRAPTKEEAAHMDRVAALGCIVCQMFYGVKSPAEIHHILGKTAPGSHFYVLPLCKMHHRGGEQGPQHVSRHPYKARFEKAYGRELDLLATVNEMLVGK